jgi:hypothetical protein
MKSNSSIPNWIYFWVIVLFIPLLFVTCEKEADKPTGDNKVVLGSTTTGSPDYFFVNVTSSITQTGGQTLTDHGFCYATAPNPDINSTVKSLGKRTEQGDFSAELTNLEDNKKYYIRAFATIAGGTLYAEQKEIATLKAGKPRISTFPLSDIGVFSAVCGGAIESDSGYAVTASGICWDIDNQFNENQCLGKVFNTSGNATYMLNIAGLIEGTSYFIKAFATNQKGTGYGEIRQFSTVPVTIPEVTTANITNPTTNSATGGGNVTNAGNATVTARGICWNTAGNPTLQNCINFTTNGQGIGSFTSNLTGLTDGVTYYAKAYGTNVKGTGYGSQVNFATLAITLPTVTTKAIINPGATSAVGGGNVISDGNATVTARGVCWNTSGSPTLQNCIDFSTDGQGTGTFTSSITGLTALTDYFVKAYATNSEGTEYGNQQNFTTAVPCGAVLTISHIAGNTAPVSKTVNYGTVQTNLSGSNKCWITQNLGADHQAASATDANESSAGWYWQFNKKQGYKHDGTTRTPNTTWITSINENNDWLPTNDPCTLLLGSGWRLPTKTEWTSADATGGWNNYNATFTSVLKLHAAGNLNYNNGSLNDRGSNGFYWGSSQNSLDNGWSLYFNSGSSNMSGNRKANGFTNRCLSD